MKEGRKENIIATPGNKEDTRGDKTKVVSEK